MSSIQEVEFNDQTGESDNSESDNEVEAENSDDEYETIDVTENPLYHVLSAFFEDDNGNNVVDKLSELPDSVNNQTRALLQTNENITQLLQVFGNLLTINVQQLDKKVKKGRRTKKVSE